MRQYRQIPHLSYQSPKITHKVLLLKNIPAQYIDTVSVMWQYFKDDIYLVSKSTSLKISYSDISLENQSSSSDVTLWHQIVCVLFKV